MSKVLIVDDHPAIRLAVRLLFERDGFTIVGEADNGAEALQVARKKSPDLAILDIGIPKIDGLEVIARLKSLKLDTKVLVLTRQNPAQFAPRCLQAGAMGFVSKRKTSPSCCSPPRPCWPATSTSPPGRCVASTSRAATTRPACWKAFPTAR